MRWRGWTSPTTCCTRSRRAPASRTPSDGWRRRSPTRPATSDLRRIVYLGGLAPEIPASRMSPHMRSRVEVGQVLRGSGVPVAEFRAAVIIGSGSASFEMLRYLTERLPAMITPTWVRQKTQPIAIRDVLRYLVAAVGPPADGQPAARDRRSGGAHLPADDAAVRSRGRTATARHPADQPAHPRAVEPLGQRRHAGAPGHRPAAGAVAAAPVGLPRARRRAVDPRSPGRARDLRRRRPPGPHPHPGRPGRDALDGRVGARAPRATRCPATPPGPAASLYEDVRVRHSTRHAASSCGAAVERIGGDHGWYSSDFLWEVRGLLDRLVGGVGLRRGRRDPDVLAVGDVVDFWRVEERLPPRLLRLRAEMKNPGLAWLEFSVEAGGHGLACCASAPCSSRAGWPATPTGGRSPPSTPSSSRR